MPCENAKTSSDIEHVDWSTGGSGQHYANVRFGSGSSQASQSSGDICRICHCESDPQNPLLTPCYCSGSLKYVHQACLQQWLTASETNSCELCKFPFIMHTKIKPFNEWRSLDISGIERRRLCCTLLFHFAAALCVIWSLCVLIERAADDVQLGRINWPFWTKLAVVTVGLTGGIVFMYIQCKAYLHLCHRWKARNRILLIQNAPEKIHPMSPPSPVAAHAQHGRFNEAHSSLAGHVHAATGTVEINAAAISAVAGHDANTSYNSSINCTAHESCLDTGSAGMNHQRLLSGSPHHMLQLAAELDLPHSSASTQTEDLHAQQQLQQQQQQLGQVAVAANIECSQLQHNYDRDWALDDVVSQISSFRPCPQGSGSMTPFHDSCSRQDLSASGISTDTGREHALQLSSFSGSGEQKAPSISSGVSHAVANGLGGFVYKPHQPKRYSNSSIFLENRDILNDSPVALGLDPTQHTYDYSTPPKIDYRHSSILATTTQPHGCREDYIGKDLRRYSDTKLLGSAGAVVTADASLEHDAMLCKHPDTVLDIELPTSPLSPPAAYAIQHQAPHTLRRSYNTVDDACSGGGIVGSNAANANMSEAQMDRSRVFFKSLPNLSSSCESLIKK